MTVSTLRPLQSELKSAGSQSLSTQPQSPNLGDIFLRAELVGDLAVIEQALMDRASAHSPVLTASGRHTIMSGGKRLRAALVLLSARLGVYNLARATHSAVAIELLHAATLIHDDLVDHAQQRRGHVTVHARWNSNVALMLGDYFLSLSTNELAYEPDPRIIHYYAQAAQTLVEGELSPVTTLEPLEVALAQYRYKITCKTAALFEVACKSGIAISSGTPEQIESLSRFGRELGMAFQIVDDVLDFIGDERTLGKPAGNDLREGTWTLPLLYAIDAGGSERLRALATSALPTSDQIAALVAEVIQLGGVARAMDEARALVGHAVGHLSGFPSSSTTRALSDICDFILARHL